MTYVFAAIVLAAAWGLAIYAAAVQDRSPSIAEWDAFREAGERMSR